MTTMLLYLLFMYVFPPCCEYLLINTIQICFGFVLVTLYFETTIQLFPQAPEKGFRIAFYLEVFS